MENCIGFDFKVRSASIAGEKEGAGNSGVGAIPAKPETANSRGVF